MIEYIKRDALRKWDARFIGMAEHIAQWSKGPRKRIGAVIVRPDRSIVSLGYNGPPRHYDDEAFLRMSREDQHNVVIHAEANAIWQRSATEKLCGCTIYVSPLFPCAGCAIAIQEQGISRVVAYCGEISDDWRASAREAEAIFARNEIDCTFAID